MNWVLIEILRKISDMLNSQRDVENRLERIEDRLERLQSSVDEGNRLARANNAILLELQDQLVIGKAVGFTMTAGPVVEQ